MNASTHLLFVSPSQTAASTVIETLRRSGLDLTYLVLSSMASVDSAFRDIAWDAVFCINESSFWTSEQLLQLADKIDPLPLLLISDGLDEGAAADLLGSGIYDVIPASLERLVPATKRMVREQELKKKVCLAQDEIDRHDQVQEILNKLLNLSLAERSLADLLETFIRQTISLPWLGLEAKGAVFLADQESDSLQLKAQIGLHPDLLQKCARVPFGRCLCGRAAQAKTVVFATRLDDRHTTGHEGIKPHGHYCVPIISRQKELVGVFTLYTREGCRRDPRNEEILKAAATVVAGIIERRKAEDALRTSEKKYRAITDTAKDAIIMLDSEGSIILWNPAAEKIFGYAAHEVLGKNCDEYLLPQLFTPFFTKGLEQYGKKSDGTAIEETIEAKAVRQNGTEFPVEISFSTFKIHNKRHSVGIVRDISRRLIAMKEKEKLQEEVQRSRNLEAITTLAGGIAHDFNNILAAIFGFTDMAKDEIPEGNPAKHDLEQVSIAAGRAKELVQQILNFSRQTDQRKEPLQLHLLIKEGLKFLRSSIPSTIKITHNISPDSGTVLAEPGQIHQVLIHLCTNAYQAMRDNGGELRVTLEAVDINGTFSETAMRLENGPYVCLAVRDTGPGMDAAIKERIFEPYFTTKNLYEGAGLGLSVVHGIVVSLGGAIFVESEPGKGALFRVYLPRQEKCRSASGVTPQIPAAKGTERLMFVDDEPALAKLGEKLLEKLGYEVQTYIDSVRAWEDFRSDPDRYDMLITDMTMPDLTGLDLAKKIFGLKPDFPIILTTGFSELITEEQVKEMGIKELIMKPIIPNELGVIIRTVLDHRNKGVY